MLAGSQGTFDNMTITNNESCCHGGGVWTNNSGDDEPGWVMTNSFISGNSGGWNGGGIAFFYSAPTLINVDFIDNSAGWSGGAVAAMMSSPNITDCTINNNQSTENGGGAFAIGGESVPIIEDCIISENTAGENGGGLMYNGIPNAILNRVFIVDNHAEEFSGGFQLAGGGSSIISNVTVSGNTSGQGGGIGLAYTSYADITNSIVWNNSGDEIDLQTSSDINIIYSNIQGDYDGVGNIDSDPLFVDPEMGNYNLQYGSPCIDAGITDINGDGTDDIVEFIGLAPDIGAHEYSIPGPIELQFNIEDNDLTFTWSPSLDFDLQYYSIQLSTDSLFSSDVLENFSPNNFFTFNDLELDVPYYFRVAAMYGQGFWSDYSEVVSVSIVLAINDPKENLPQFYSLNQNYPNPFNPVTAITYEVPNKSDVILIIVNIRGNIIKTLFNGNVDAGYHSIEWDGTNDLGGKVAAGMYFYTIQTQNFNKTRKMIFLK